MRLIPAVILVLSVSVLGCSDRPANSTTSSELTETATELAPSRYPKEIQDYLTKLQTLVRKYNSEANGIELSQHGVDGHLDDETAKEMVAYANSILEEINDEFDQPVSRTIGDLWYQVPSQFKLVALQANGDSNAHAFTISHHNCGLHEFDFVVDNGQGLVGSKRYDSLGVAW